MSEEEKKAIEYFKSNLERTKEMGKRWGFQEEIKNNEIILNLIDKKQEEIEVLKEDLDKKVKALDIAMSNPDYICKDKIREKMREIMGYTISSSEERHCQNYAYDRLKELLEEK